MTSRPAGFWQSLLGYTLLDALQRASFVILLPIYLSALAPDALGALVLYNVIAAVLAIVANLRLDAAIRTHYFLLDNDRLAQDRYLATVFSAGLLLILFTLGIILAAGPSLFQAVTSNDQLQFFPHGLMAVGVAFANTALAPLFAFLRNRRDLRAFAGMSLFLLMTNIAAQAWLLLRLDLGLTGALVGALLPPLLLLCGLLLIQPRRLLRWPNFADIRPSLRFSVPLVAFSLLFLLESRFDRFFIERFLDLEMLGAYGVLSALLGLTPMLLNALDASVRPWLYDALGQSNAIAAPAVAVFGKLYLACGLLSLSVVACAGFMMSLVTDDPRFLVVTDWILFGVTALVPLVFTRYWGLLYLYNGKTLRLTWWTLVRTLAIFLLLYVLVPQFGVEGALAALLLSQLINALIFRWELARLHCVRSVSGSAVAQVAAFVGIIWGGQFMFPEADPVPFGAVQLLLFLAVMLVVHRRTPADLRKQLNVSQHAAATPGCAT